MIRIEVIAKNGAPLASPLAAEFDELGGKIGRGEDAVLVLADPERTISRTHAAVAVRGGRYVLHDHGSAIPVYINGRALGNGHEAPIQPGDEIRIGPYTLEVKAAQAASPAPRRGDASSPDLVASTGGAGPLRPRDDPLALFSGESSGANADPFQERMSPVPRQQKRSAGPPLESIVPKRERPSALDDPFAAPVRPGSHHGSNGAIPDDFDAVAMPPPSPPGSAAPPESLLPEDLDLGPAMSGSRKLDTLYDLGPRTGPDPFPPGHPLAPPLERPTATREDLLASISPTPKASIYPTQPDHTSDLHAPFTPLKARPAPVTADSEIGETGAESTPNPRKGTVRERSMIVSWEDQTGFDGAIKTVIISPGQPADEASARSGREAEAALSEDRDRRTGPASSARRETAQTSAARVPTPTSSAPRGRGSSQPIGPSETAPEELLRAYLEGAGVPNLDMPGGLTPQLMRVLGQLLRAATEGTLDLLVARAIAKRELRANATVIKPRENNPLKFSPNAEGALAHLLAPTGGGFMTPIRAMQDAYDDLRAHQVASMAGMRAALAGVLERFDPEVLEGRLTKQNFIDALVPMTRRAKLWDLFNDLYRDIAREAEDDFHTLFGREFLRAYEAQLARLETERNRAPAT